MVQRYYVCFSFSVILSFLFILVLRVFPMLVVVGNDLTLVLLDTVLRTFLIY
ncbi:hypothetical protein HanIR_Chr08g0371341 [Helianthus annuus]|nr:hypothetical protein HanIR_Chr08g0371341 [Helianthus annuus]